MSNTKVYEIITDKILAEMAKGIIPWNKPWVSYNRVGGTIKIGARAVSHVTGKPYSLINQLLLGRSGEYVTFKQCQAEGGKIKKGATASYVCFWKQLPVEKKDENGNVVLDESGNPEKEIIPFLRYYTVFHLDDTEGLKQKWASKTGEQELVIADDHAELIDEADSIFMDYINREHITLQRDSVSDEAYYAPGRDLINLPNIKQFTSAAEYYSTAFHEATHSTGHSKRLDRFSKQANHRFGSSDYSKEELVAEIGAASILHSIGISTEGSFKNSVAYLQGWSRAFKNDVKMIVSAASKAEKAVAFIFGNGDTADAEGEE